MDSPQSDESAGRSRNASFTASKAGWRLRNSPLKKMPIFSLLFAHRPLFPRILKRPCRQRWLILNALIGLPGVKDEMKRTDEFLENSAGEAESTACGNPAKRFTSFSLETLVRGKRPSPESSARFSVGSASSKRQRLLSVTAPTLNAVIRSDRDQDRRGSNIGD